MAMSVTVILGAHHISSQEPSQQEIPVEKWVIHPQYSRKGYKNDIMLLKINEYVQCISIAKANEHVRAGDLCTVSGWGRTSLYPPPSDVLREVELKVQKEKICQQVFLYYQPHSMICVGDENNKKASYKVSVVLGCKLGKRLGLEIQISSEVKAKGQQNEPRPSE
uniref:Peptidase S1 domain-containing protein n=1 Tax=Zonotrichia albicollis TaxID=44394 RepID=A0A8D2M405_ZONAL